MWGQHLYDEVREQMRVNGIDWAVWFDVPYEQRLAWCAAEDVMEERVAHDRGYAVY